MQDQLPVVPTTPAVSLVSLSDGEPRTTTLMISEGTEVQHKNVLGLVRTYLTDLSEFGRVAFQTRLNTQGSPTEYATLNEGQATLLLTYMRNSDIVREFKKRLVRDFLSYKQQVNHNPANMSRMQLLQMAMQAEEERMALEHKVDALKPKADIADRIAISDGLFGFRHAAKILKINENKFRNWLIQNDWIYYLGKKMTAKSPAIKKGYLEEKMRTLPCEAGEEPKTVPEMYFTAAGIHKLAEIFNVELELSSKEAA